MRVLVVDDDDIVAEVTADLLERCGFETRQTTDGVAALDLLGAEPFDTLLTDYQMPALSGTELARRARALLPGLRIVVMSGARPAGTEGLADAVVMKPYTLDTLVTAVQGGAPSRSP